MLFYSPNDDGFPYYDRLFADKHQLCPRRPSHTAV